MKKTLILLSIMLLLVSCLQQNIPATQEQEIPLFFAKSSNIDVTVATCRVTGDDMDTIQVALNVSATEITGTIPSVPYGDDRLFEIFCYSSTGEMNYYGSATADINSIAPVINIVLYPKNNEADVTIVGTFGDPEDPDEKVVFVADWNGNYDVYIMNANGTNIEQISFSAYDAALPRLSPDRSKVSYQRRDDNGNQGFIIDLETGQEQMLENLSQYNLRELSWHPTENKLLFRDVLIDSMGIYEYDMDKDTVKKIITDPRRIWGVRYTPDGNHLVYHAEINGTFKACKANRDGSGEVLLYPSPYTEERTIRVNPKNDNKIIFAGRGFDSNSYIQWGLYFLDTQDQSINRVISTMGVDEGRPVWSPNGEKILYERRDAYGYGLYTIKPDGSENAILVDHPGNERYPDWQ